MSGKSVDLRAKCEVRSIESNIGPIIIKFGINDCGSQPLRGSILPATQFLKEANIRYVFRVMDLEGIGGGTIDLLQVIKWYLSCAEQSWVQIEVRPPRE